MLVDTSASHYPWCPRWSCCSAETVVVRNWASDVNSLKPSVPCRGGPAAVAHVGRSVYGMTPASATPGEDAEESLVGEGVSHVVNSGCTWRHPAHRHRGAAESRPRDPKPGAGESSSDRRSIAEPSISTGGIRPNREDDVSTTSPRGSVRESACKILVGPRFGNDHVITKCTRDAFSQHVVPGPRRTSVAWLREARRAGGQGNFPWLGAADLQRGRGPRPPARKEPESRGNCSHDRVARPPDRRLRGLGVRSGSPAYRPPAPPP